MSTIESVDRTTASQFLLVSAVMEVGAGLVLLLVPALVIGPLFGVSGSGAGVAIGRLAGASLLSLGAACWWARHDAASAGSRALVSGMLIYNAAVVALVLSASFGPLGAPLLALAVLHGAMALWCVWLLRVVRSARGEHDVRPA
jgi:hypothetical protein